MPHKDWISVGEYSGGMAAGVVARRLNIEGIPNRVVDGGVRVGQQKDLTHYIWVPLEWVERAKRVIDQPAVPEDELEREALAFPRPDDVSSLGSGVASRRSGKSQAWAMLGLIVGSVFVVAALIGLVRSMDDPHVKAWPFYFFAAAGMAMIKSSAGRGWD
jgi:hypothetical protein